MCVKVEEKIFVLCYEFFIFLFCGVFYGCFGFCVFIRSWGEGEFRDNNFVVFGCFLVSYCEYDFSFWRKGIIVRFVIFFLKLVFLKKKLKNDLNKK